MAPLVIISFLLVASRCCSARLLENELFIAPANPSAFDPNSNSVADDHVEKDAVQCDREDSRCTSSSTTSSKNSVNVINKLSFKLSPIIQNIKNANEFRASNEAEGVSNLMPEGGPRLKVNSVQITEQRLSTSSHSPGVGHMQMVRHKTETRNADIFKSHHSNGDDHLQQNKRKLGSTPSPGVGH